MPKDFAELMTGVIALMLVGSVLLLAGHEVWINGPFAKDFVSALVLALGAGYGYWLSSSSGSRKKSDEAAALSLVAAGVPPTPADKALVTKVTTEVKP